MLIKANHAPLFLVNSYYPCFTLALTNDSARHCESLEVMEMQPGRAAFRSPHWHVHLEVTSFTPAQVLVESVKMWDVLLTHKNTSLLDSFFFSLPPWLVQNETPAVEQRLLKVPKAEDALNLPFRELSDLLRGKAEWCHFSCFTLAPRGQNVAWCDLGITRLSRGAPQETLRFHWWNMAGARCY